MTTEISPSELDVIEAGKKLTNWKNPPTVRDLKANLESAKNVTDTQVAKISKWLDNLNVTGSAAHKPTPGNSSVTPKLIRKQAEWRYSALSEPFLSNPDLFRVSPVTWEDAKAAEHNQLILAQQFNTDINKTRFIDEYTRTLVDEGTAILRVNWVFEEEEVEVEKPVVELIPSDEALPLMEELAALQADSPAEFEASIPEELKIAFEAFQSQGIPAMPNVLRYETVKEMKTIKNHPTVEVCDYRNVVIDPTCEGDIDKAQFVIYSYTSDLAALRRDGRYSNLDKISINHHSPLSSPDHSVSEDAGSFEYEDKPRKKLTVYEYWGYWDIDGTGLVEPFVATWVDNVLIRLEENPYPDKKLPFIVVHYLPVRKSVYGEPDGALLEDNQRIAGAVTRGMIDLLAKSANSQVAFTKGALDPVNKRRFESGDTYEINPNMHASQAIYMHTFPDIPVSAQYMLNLQNMEAESLTGVKSFSQGMSQGSLGNVATSVKGVLDAASKREVGILRRMSDGIIQLGKKIISMNAEFLSEKEVVRITNEEFTVIYRDSLSGNFDLKLTISSAEEDESKAQELAFMLQTMGNTLDMGLSQFLLAEIAKLRKMPELAKRIKDYEPQPDPMAEMMQQMQMQLLEAQIAKEQAQARYYETYAGYNANKADTEIYKQAEMQAEVDRQNLDFIEQETGVTQARNLELREAQAKSQMELAALNHTLKQEAEERGAIRDYLLKGNSKSK